MNQFVNLNHILQVPKVPIFDAVIAYEIELRRRKCVLIATLAFTKFIIPDYDETKRVLKVRSDYRIMPWDRINDYLNYVCMMSNIFDLMIFEANVFSPPIQK